MRGAGLKKKKKSSKKPREKRRTECGVGTGSLISQTKKNRMGFTSVRKIRPGRTERALEER